MKGEHTWGLFQTTRVVASTLGLSLVDDIGAVSWWRNSGGGEGAVVLFVGGVGACWI